MPNFVSRMMKMFNKSPRIRKEKLPYYILLIILFLFLFLVILNGILVYINHVIYGNMDKEPLISPFLYVVSLAVIISLIVLLYFMNIKRTYRLMMAQKAIIFALASLAEWRDPETGHHLTRTRDYAVILSKQIRKMFGRSGPIDESFIEDIYDAAPLHDIGKVGIRDAILFKPGKLTETEFNEMKRHVAIGKEIMEKVIDQFQIKERFILMARNIAAYHHEKYDGTGYLEGLKKEEIPVEARIFSICDVYDALRTRRPYKEPLSHHAALNIIDQESGRHFDPKIVKAFMACNEKIMEVFETYHFLSEYHYDVVDLKAIDRMALKWTPDMSTGIEYVDKQHQELFERVNELLRAILRGDGKEELLRILSFLEEYVKIHFKTEENYMNNYNNPLYELHKREHLLFAERFFEIKNRLLSNGVSSRVLLETARYLVDWLKDHTTRTDMYLKI